MIDDFRKDWQRWTRLERVSAIVLLTLAVVFLPTLLAFNAHSPSF
jgi:hypothetical protein